MAVVVQPQVWANGQTLTAIALNANPAAFVAGFANIDHVNIGSAGLYASQLIPTTGAQATFGGSVAYTFGNGLTVNGAFSIAGALSGVTTLTTTGLITGVGVAVGGALTTATTGTFSGAVSMAGLTATTGTFSGAVSGLTSLSIAGRGQAQSDGATSAYLPPVYSTAGAALANTTHMVRGTGTCDSTGTLVVNLTGAAAFASGTSYTVVASCPYFAAIITIVNNSASQFTILINLTVVTTINFMALGT